MARNRLGKRVISSNLRKRVNAEVSDEVLVFLITLKHSLLDENIYVSSDPTEPIRYEETQITYGTVSRGITFEYAGFEASLPNDEDGASPTLEITLPNASRALIEYIERLGNDVVYLDLELVLAETPDIVEMQCIGMELTNITYDESSVSGTVSRDMLFNEPLPNKTMIPQHFPFLFARRS